MDPAPQGNDLRTQIDKLDKLRGMPSGFPFAMVLLGVLAFVVAFTLGGINEYWFRNMNDVLRILGTSLIEFGSLLQIALWVCQAFGKRSA